MADGGNKGRGMLIGAGLLGVSGVAAAAASAHAASDPRLLGAVALVCLAHAPAIMTLGLSEHRGTLLRVAALLLFAGASLFSADMASRAYEYGRLFPMAAPAGGLIMMAGWLTVAASALASRR